MWDEDSLHYIFSSNQIRTTYFAFIHINIILKIKSMVWIGPDLSITGEDPYSVNVQSSYSFNDFLLIFTHLIFSN
jgi:hypothetical protein